MKTAGVGEREMKQMSVPETKLGIPAMGTCGHHVLYLSTIQSAPFRTLITALKDMLMETGMTFTAEGISVLAMDKTQVMMANVTLHAENFDTYKIKEGIVRINIQVNMNNLFKLINTIDNEDVLSIYIEEDDYIGGIVKHLSLRFDNGNIHQSKTHKLLLMDSEPEPMELMPKLHFASILSIPSQDFQKTVRDMSNISDKMEILSVGRELIFRARGGFAASEIRRQEPEEVKVGAGGEVGGGKGGMKGGLSRNNIIKDEKARGENQIIQGIFPLKYLSHFTKCTNLCPQLEL